MPGTLHICRTETEACLGAVSASTPGFAVSLVEEVGVLCARTATSTIFGPVIRRHNAPDRGLIDSLVLDTLAAEEHDVWLYCVDAGIADDLADEASRRGNAVVRVTGPKPSAVPDPFALFSVRRVRAGGSPTVLSFCKVDPRERPPVAVGDVLGMKAVEEGDGGCMVFYVDKEGAYVGLHGRLPYPLDDEGLQLLSATSAPVSYISWGREWRGGRLVPIQIAMFDIPAEVDAILADARLPHEDPREG